MITLFNNLFIRSVNKLFLFLFLSHIFALFLAKERIVLCRYFFERQSECLTLNRLQKGRVGKGGREVQDEGTDLYREGWGRGRQK